MTVAGTGVKPHPKNLSAFRPETVPHRSTSWAMHAVGMLITKSLVASIILNEYRPGLMLTYTIGGSEHMVPVQAIVIMLGAISFDPQLTRTTGTGNRAV